MIIPKHIVYSPTCPTVETDDKHRYWQWQRLKLPLLKNRWKLMNTLSLDSPLGKVTVLHMFVMVLWVLCRYGGRPRSTRVDSKYNSRLASVVKPAVYTRAPWMDSFGAEVQAGDFKWLQVTEKRQESSLCHEHIYEYCIKI